MPYRVMTAKAGIQQATASPGFRLRRYDELNSDTYFCAAVLSSHQFQRGASGKISAKGQSHPRGRGD
jgi:hypothetical protein